MERYQTRQAARRATMPELLAEAGELGITDGLRPMAAATRQEAAVMCRRVQKNLEAQLPGLVRAVLEELDREEVR